MSKAKKSSKSTPETVNWDEGLLNAAVQEVKPQCTARLCSFCAFRMTGNHAWCLHVLTLYTMNHTSRLSSVQSVQEHAEDSLSLTKCPCYSRYALLHGFPVFIESIRPCFTLHIAGSRGCKVGSSCRWRRRRKEEQSRCSPSSSETYVCGGMYIHSCFVSHHMV